MNVKTMYPYEITSAVRGLGFLNFPESYQLLNPVSKRIMEDPMKFPMNYLVWILWSYTKLKYPSNALIDTVVHAPHFSLDIMSEEILSVFLWVLAKTHNQASPHLVPKIKDLLYEKLSPINNAINSSKVKF